MAEIKENSSKAKPRSSSFMGCFGLTRKAPKKMLSHDNSDMVKSGGLKKKKTRWILCSKFGVKKSAAKTVPMGSPVAEKFDTGSETHSLKLEKKVSSKKHRRSPVPDKAINDKVQKKRSDIAKDIILENREMDLRSRSSEPGSPEVNKHVSNLTTTLPPHSAALPPPAQKRKKVIRAGDDTVGGNKPDPETDNQFDAVFGMSIIMVTLVIMLFWGKLCAILCTSAWFFMVSRLRRVTKSSVVVKEESNSGGPDLNSEEYKKKVVLEGLLTRNHRSRVVGVL